MVSNWQVTPKPIVMGACWGDLLLWFICRWEKKGNIPKVLQGFRNLQKGHRGYTWAHYLHLSGECQQERMSFRCCTGGKLRETYGCIHIGSYKVPWKNIWDTAFLHAGSFFIIWFFGAYWAALNCRHPVEVLWCPEQMCGAGRMSLDNPAQPVREKVSAMLLWEAGTSTCACTSRIQSTFRRNRERRLFPQDRARRRRSLGTATVSML